MGDRFHNNKTTPTKTEQDETPLIWHKGRLQVKRCSTEKSQKNSLKKKLKRLQNVMWGTYFKTWLCADYLFFSLGDSNYFRRFVKSFVLIFKFLPELF